MAKSTPTSLPEFDRLEYAAEFDSKGRIRVERKQKGFKKRDRGSWIFEWQGKADWRCVDFSGPEHRAGTMDGYSKQFVPEPVLLKAKIFLIAQVQVKAEPSS